MLEALRLCRAAERAMRRRTRDEISSAATSVLVERLDQSGHVQREPDADGNPVVVRATAHADDDVRHTLGRMHELMYAVAAGMDARAQQNVAEFLRAMADAVDGVEPAGSDDSRQG